MLLSENWNHKDGPRATCVVARQSPRSGKIAVASFLVDLACLGVKSAFVRLCKNPADYQQRVIRSLAKYQALEPSDLNMVTKIINEGLIYARQLGFSPDPEYNQSQLLLAGADPAACNVHIPLGGKEGKPIYIAGPSDNIEQVIATLTRTVGPDGFHFVVPAEHPQSPHFASGLPGTLPSRLVGPDIDQDEDEDDD